VKNPLVLASELLYNIGTMIVLDDFRDYGRFDRAHHWLLGEVMRQLALLGGVINLFINLLERSGEDVTEIRRKWEAIL